MFEEYTSISAAMRFPKVPPTSKMTAAFLHSTYHNGRSLATAKGGPKLIVGHSRRDVATAVERASTERSLTRSARGQRAVQLLPTYLADARSVEKYSPQYPNGALQLGVAESQMLEDWLVPALNIDLKVSPDCIYYQPTPGRQGFRTAMASYMEDMLDLDKGRIDTEGLVVGAGCNAVLENLCICLAEAGDAVLIPTPYYAAFEFDLVARADLYVQAVTTRDHHPEVTSSDDPAIYYPSEASLDAAFEKALIAGHAPRILLISHPQNPLGICYPPEVMKICINWCRSRRVHLISDEIYAGSIYRPELAGFSSALKLADTQRGLGPYVHWVYALSKDFALSGLRVGAVYSENLEIRTPMQKLNDLCQISSTTQLWTETILNRVDAKGNSWVHSFRKENHRRLEARIEALTSVLDEVSIPYLAPTAGLFVWINMSQFLTEDSNLTDSERERKLYLSLVQEFGILLTPGDSTRNEHPGYFRCVFTAASDEEFELSLIRFRAFANARR
jgi:aspartate/methionine/tyrosine aminotransferase